MRYVVYGSIFASVLFIQDGFASEPLKDFPNLNEISQASNPLKSLEDLEVGDPARGWALCQEILDKNFFHTTQAQKMGVLKSRKVSSYCQGLKERREKPQVGALKAHQPAAVSKTPMEKKVGTIAPEKKAAFSKPEPEPFHRKPPALKTGAKGFAAQQEQLQSNKQEIEEYVKQMQRAEDVHAQERARDYERRLEEVNKNIENAKTYYNNLLEQIKLLREDFNEFSALKAFNEQHVDDSPEDFLEAFEKFQKAKKLDIRGLGQVQFAHEELKKALLAQQNGEHELAAIYMQMDVIHTSHN